MPLVYWAEPLEIEIRSAATKVSPGATRRKNALFISTSRFTLPLNEAVRLVPKGRCLRQKLCTGERRQQPEILNYQRGLEFRERPGAVTQAVLRILAQFRKGLRETIRHEQWIVPKSALPAWRELDTAFVRVFKQLRLRLELVRVANRRRAFHPVVNHRCQGKHAS